MTQPSLLLAEDDPGAAVYLRILLEEAGYTVLQASNGVEALLALETAPVSLVLSDLNMPVMDGSVLLRHVRERWPGVPFIFVTVESDLAQVVEAVREGAVNYLVKPVNPAALLDAVTNALLCAASPAQEGEFPEIVGRSPAMVKVRHQVCLACRTELHVVIMGETGTGKELVARCIHRGSARRQGPFVAHNCALSQRELFESEFFGHVRGAFTGADRDHVGLLERGDGGVLLLDELETLPPDHQAKLLRVMDDGGFRRVGSGTTRHVSVRFIGATNRDLLPMIRAAGFREDLYFRLRGHEIVLPPLRGRREDIPTLTAHFLEGQGASVSAEAMERLCAHEWPGNVRELRNVVLFARAAAGPGRRITSGHLPESMSRPGPARTCPEEAPVAAQGTLRDVERDAIQRELVRWKGNRTLAARTLGIDRSTLRRKLAEYDLLPRVSDSEDPQ